MICVSVRYMRVCSLRSAAQIENRVSIGTWCAHTNMRPRDNTLRSTLQEDFEIKSARRAVEHQMRGARSRLQAKPLPNCQIYDSRRFPRPSLTHAFFGGGCHRVSTYWRDCPATTLGKGRWKCGCLGLGRIVKYMTRVVFPAPP